MLKQTPFSRDFTPGLALVGANLHRPRAGLDISDPAVWPSEARKEARKPQCCSAQSAVFGLDRSSCHAWQPRDDSEKAGGSLALFRAARNPVTSALAN